MDPLAVYGAVASSAGMLGLAYNAWSTHLSTRDDVTFTVDYITGMRFRDDYITDGVSVAVVNRSKHHAIHVRMCGLEQDDAECVVFSSGTIEPRREFNDVFFSQTLIDCEELDLRQPVRAFVLLEDGTRIASDRTCVDGAPAPNR